MQVPAPVRRQIIAFGSGFWCLPDELSQVGCIAPCWLMRGATYATGDFKVDKKLVARSPFVVERRMACHLLNDRLSVAG